MHKTTSFCMASLNDSLINTEMQKQIRMSINDKKNHKQVRVVLINNEQTRQ